MKTSYINMIHLNMTYYHFYYCQSLSNVCVYKYEGRKTKDLITF